MFRRFAATVAVTLVLPATALAGGGNYAFDGATPAERATVRAALNASAFDWGIVPKRVTIHVGAVGTSHAQPRAHLARPRPARRRPLRLGDGDGRVRAPGRLPRARSDSAGRSCSSGWARAPGATRSTGLVPRRLRLRALLLDGRLGLLAVEGELLPPRVAADESAAMPAPEFRQLLSAARRRAELADSGPRRSATAAAPSQRPAYACRRRAWPSPCARASARSRAR